MISDSKGPSVGLPPLALIPAVPVGCGAAAPGAPENTSAPFLSAQTTWTRTATIDVNVGDWLNVTSLACKLFHFGDDPLVDTPSATFSGDDTYALASADVGEQLFTHVVPDGNEDYAIDSFATPYIGLDAIANATPADATTSPTLNPVFTWDALAGATDELHLYYDENGLDEVALDNNTGLTGGTYTADPTSGTKLAIRENYPYYWKITRTLNGQSVSTPLRELTVGIASLEDVKVYWKMDEASGTEFASQIAGVAALTPVNVVLDADAAGPNDGSLDFIDGSPAPYWDGTAYVPYRAAISPIAGDLSYTQFSWVFWLKIEAAVWTDATARYLWNENSGGTTRTLDMRRLTTNNNLFWSATMGGTAKTATISAVNSTAWRPCVLVVDDAGDRADIYIDDMVTPKSSLTETGTSSSSAWDASRNMFGAFTAADTNKAIMYMRNAARINHSLNQEERELLKAAFAAYAPPSAPQAVAPGDQDDTADSTPALSWTDTGATDYDLEISSTPETNPDGTFVTTVETQSAIATNATTAAALAAIGRYWWHVRDNDTGLWADAVSFYYGYAGFDQAYGAEVAPNGASGFSFTGDNPDGYTTDNESAPSREVSEVDSGQGAGGTNVTGGSANFSRVSQSSGVTCYASSIFTSGYYRALAVISQYSNPGDIDRLRVHHGNGATLDTYIDAGEVGTFIGVTKPLSTQNTGRLTIGTHVLATGTADGTLDSVSVKKYTLNTTQVMPSADGIWQLAFTVGTPAIGEIAALWSSVQDDSDFWMVIATYDGTAWTVDLLDVQSDTPTVRVSAPGIAALEELGINKSGNSRIAQYKSAGAWVDIDAVSVSFNDSEVGVVPFWTDNITPTFLRRAA